MRKERRRASEVMASESVRADEQKKSNNDERDNWKRHNLKSDYS